MSLFFLQKTGEMRMGKKKTKKFKDVSKEYMEIRKQDLRPTSFASYMHLLQKRIVPAVGDIKVGKFSNRDLQEFVDKSQETGYSKHGTRDCVSIIKLVLKYAAENGYCKERSMSVKYARVSEKRRNGVMDDEEYAKLLRFCMSHPGKRTFPTLIAMTTGLRIGEVCALRYGDIDFEKATINIERSVKRICNAGEKSFVEISAPKTASSVRYTPVPKEILGLLKENRKGDGVYISSESEAMPLEPRTYRQKYGRLLKSLGISPHTFHDLRHTFASRCINAGADARTVADILGHTNVEMTLNIYTHSTSERKRAVAETAVKLP